MLAGMPSLPRRAIAWLLALVMPFHVLTAVYLDVRGPAHVHVAQADGGNAGESARAPGHAHTRPHEYSHVIGALRLHGYARESGHSHGHAHGGIERHHHDPADSSVVTVDGDGKAGLFALREETTSGWSGIMLVALLALAAALKIPGLAGTLAPAPAFFLKTPSLGRLKRPPRPSPA